MTDAPALFHIGYVKTATTFLQQAVFCDPAFGMGLPGGATGRGLLAAQVLINDDYLFDPAAAGAALAAAEAPLRAAGLLPVWSEEVVLGNPIGGIAYGRPVLEKIAAAVPGAKLMITIREQKSFALSAWLEHIEHHGLLGLSDFIGTGTEAPGFLPRLRPDFLFYDRAIGWCMERFGAENVLVLPIEALKRDRSGYFERLAAFTGCPIDPSAVPAAAANPARGAASLALKRLLNRLTVRSPLSGRPSRAIRGVNRTLRALDRAVPAALDTALKTRWQAQIDARYGTMFAESNARSSALIGQDLAALGY